MTSHVSINGAPALAHPLSFLLADGIRTPCLDRVVARVSRAMRSRGITLAGDAGVLRALESVVFTAEVCDTPQSARILREVYSARALSVSPEVQGEVA